MAHKPVGAATSIATTNSSAKTSAIKVTTNVLRITALNTDAYVVVGGEPTASLSDYIIPANTSAGIGVTKASQRVVGVTTGTTTIITCPEGTQMPFVEGDRVTLTGANFAHYDTLIKHAKVISVNTTSTFDGNFQTSITVDTNTAAITTSFSAPDATLRRSLKVSALSQGGTGGSIHVQQVQITGQA